MILVVSTATSRSGKGLNHDVDQEMLPLIRSQRTQIILNNFHFQQAATEPFGVQAENTLHVNYFSLLNTCHVLFPLLRPHARVVNLSSSAGHLSKIPGKLLRKQLSSSSLTEEELTDLLKQFVK
jgi:carbonyl reductase 1